MAIVSDGRHLEPMSARTRALEDLGSKPVMAPIFHQGEGRCYRQLFLRHQSLGIDVSAVCRPDDGDHKGVVHDVVEHAVVTDADPPSVLFSRELLSARRARVLFKTGNSSQDTTANPRVQFTDLLGGCSSEFGAVGPHASSSARSSFKPTRPPSSSSLAVR